MSGYGVVYLNSNHSGQQTKAVLEVGVNPGPKYGVLPILRIWEYNDKGMLTLQIGNWVPGSKAIPAIRQGAQLAAQHPDNLKYNYNRPTLIWMPGARSGVHTVKDAQVANFVGVESKWLVIPFKGHGELRILCQSWPTAVILGRLADDLAMIKPSQWLNFPVEPEPEYLEFDAWTLTQDNPTLPPIKAPTSGIS